MNRGFFFVCLVAALTLLSCSEPSCYEEFIKEEQSTEGIYKFTLNLSDSTAVHDVYLVTRCDRNPAKASNPYPMVGMHIWWESPSGRVFEETVYMDFGDYRGQRQLYRSAIVPSEFGKWSLYVKPLDPPAFFRGMGVVMKSNKDGSR